MRTQVLKWLSLVPIATLICYGAIAQAQVIGSVNDSPGTGGILAAGAADTTANVDIRRASGATIFCQYNGDSLEVTTQISLDATTWATVAVDTLNGADSAAELLLYKTMVLPSINDAASNLTANAGGGFGTWLRVILNNFDSASPCSLMVVRVLTK